MDNIGKPPPMHVCMYTLIRKTFMLLGKTLRYHRSLNPIVGLRMDAGRPINGQSLSYSESES